MFADAIRWWMSLFCSVVAGIEMDRLDAVVAHTAAWVDVDSLVGAAGALPFAAFAADVNGFWIRGEEKH